MMGKIIKQKTHSHIGPSLSFDFLSIYLLLLIFSESKDGCLFILLGSFNFVGRKDRVFWIYSILANFRSPTLYLKQIISIIYCLETRLQKRQVLKMGDHVRGNYINLSERWWWLCGNDGRQFESRCILKVKSVGFPNKLIQCVRGSLKK